MPEAVVNWAGRAGAEAARDDASPRHALAVALLVSAAYYLTTKVGFAFALQPGSVSTLWMPNAILLAAFLLLPRRSWWVVLLAAGPAHFAAELQSGVPTAMVASWFVSNSVQALIGAVCIDRFVEGRLRFDSFRGLTIFLLCGALLAPFLSSFLDIALVQLNGWGHGSFWESWRIRFLSNVLATLTLVPVIVMWAAGGLKATLKAPPRRYVEAALLALGLFAVGGVAFGVEHQVVERTPSLLYWPLPFLLWAAVRFGPRGASTCLLLVMFLAISGATHGQGPFVANSSADNALSIQWFLIVVSVPLMSLAVVLTEREQAEVALLESNERNQAILRALPDLVFLNNREGVYLGCHTRNPDALLVSPSVFMGKNIRDVLPPELAERFMDCFARLDGTDETLVLEYSLEMGGEAKDYEARLVGAEGDKVLSIVRDVTETHRAAEAVRRGEEKLRQSNRQVLALAARLINAQESERRRISLQLHDDLSQNIATLGLAISRLKRKLPDSKEGITAELDGLGQQTKDLTTQLRRLSHQLHPAVLEHLGLVAALESEATEFGHEEKIDVQFSAAVRSEKIPFDVSVCLYRVALEALRNVSRHSGAAAARLSLAEDEDSLVLEVSDSGRGFDVERAGREGGLGLVSAEERVKLLQGTFEVRSKPDGGTTLVARIPLAR
jgi:signal transduction histidine kinase